VAPFSWLVKELILAAAVLVCLVSGCVSLPTETFRGYSGTELPNTHLALLDMGQANGALIDGMYYVDGSNYRIVKMLPGPHRIDWTHTYNFSPMVNTQMLDDFRHIATVSLEPGHKYRLQADRTTGQGYRVYMWIEDSSTGAVVAGVKKP